MARRRMRRGAGRVLVGVLIGLLWLCVGFAGASGPEVARLAEPSDGVRPAARAAQAAAMPAAVASVAADDYMFLFKWGAQTPVGEFYYADAVAAAADGTVYVTDSSNDRIQRFTSTGAFLGKWGHKGSGDGQFEGP